MRERMISFSVPMVPPVLDGRKTQTRRCVKPQPVWVFDDRIPVRTPDANPSGAIRCPYGQPGDLLRVRERCWIWGRWTRNGLTAKGRQKWRFRAEPERRVRFDQPEAVAPRSAPEGQDGPIGWVMRLPRFMPRWASRITLRVTGVRVERLQQISEFDAMAEGVDGWVYDTRCETARDGFRVLWQSINGKGSWRVNPYVWVVEFERVEGATNG